MTRELLISISGLNSSMLSAYTYARRHSAYPGAKDDFEVFNDAGALVFLGRSFPGSFTAYWRPDPDRRSPALAAATFSNRPALTL